MRFGFLFSHIAGEVKGSKGGLPCLPTLSTVYCVLGGIGADLDGGVVYGVALTLVAGVEASDDQSRGGIF